MNTNNFDAYGWHFKPKIGKLIFSRIFNDKNSKIDKNFGTLLSKENISNYLKKLSSDLKKYQ